MFMAQIEVFQLRFSGIKGNLIEKTAAKDEERTDEFQWDLMRKCLNIKISEIRSLPQCVVVMNNSYTACGNVRALFPSFAYVTTTQCRPIHSQNCL